MNLRRKALVISRALDEVEKEIYWHHELLRKRLWLEMEKSESRIDALFAHAIFLMDEALLGKDEFIQSVQESFL